MDDRKQAITILPPVEVRQDIQVMRLLVIFLAVGHHDVRWKAGHLCLHWTPEGAATELPRICPLGIRNRKVSQAGESYRETGGVS